MESLTSPDPFLEEYYIRSCFLKF